VKRVRSWRQSVERGVSIPSAAPGSSGKLPQDSRDLSDCGSVVIGAIFACSGGLTQGIRRNLSRVDRTVVQPDCRWTRDASVSNQVDIGTLARSRVPLGKMTTIKRIRVFAAIAFAGLFLQLILAGSGFACVIPTASHGGDGAMASGATMVGMEMPASDQSIPASPDETPCHLPWAPAGCQPMAPCSPAVMTSPAVTFDSPPSVVEGVSRHTVIAPPTRTVPPELPPPRV